MRAVVGAVCVLLWTAVLAAPAGAHPDVAASRIDGADRVDTAANVAERTFAAGSTGTAVLAAADRFPDALSGIGVATAAVGPTLLTGRDRVPDRTLEALEVLGVQVVYLVGGDAAISPAVAEQLDPDYEVRRVGGDDRYATAADVARLLAQTGPLGQVDGDVTALLATGQDFPDALSAGPLAYARRLPVLLTRQDEVPPATGAVLEELGVRRVLVFGGERAVAAEVVQRLREAGLAVERLAGGDRTQTAAAVADALVSRFGFSPSVVLLTRGDDFPDSLAAGPRGGQRGAPLLLARTPEALGPATASWLAQHCPDVTGVQAIGGRGAVWSSTLQAAVDAGESCGAPQRQISYQTGVRGDVTADAEGFRQAAAATLNDGRGWGLSGDLEFVQVDEGGEFRLWLATPEEVDAAAAGCSPSYSCRVGDDVYINERRWQESTPTYGDRSLNDYRQYVITHEVGHWLGLGHAQCPGEGELAPVMQQQSISLDGCRSNVWPLESERQAVRERQLG